MDLALIDLGIEFNGDDDDDDDGEEDEFAFTLTA
jgi:hypothetical protein